MAIAQPRRETIHHKRAHGKHHKQDEHYLKAYRPYLPLLLLVIIALAINIVWTSHTRTLNTNVSMSPVELLSGTNAQRVRDHESNLALNSKLSAAAQAKANDMVERDYWSHVTPDGKTPWTFLKGSGYQYRLAGENLAYGFLDSGSVITAWMNSPEHRANVLNDDYEEVGFGVATSSDFQGSGRATVVVAMYGTPQSAKATATIPSGFASTVDLQPYRTVSRIQMLSGGYAPWSLSVLIALTMLAASIFALRHAFAWHRLLVRGEAFVIKHKVLDLLVINLVLIGLILSRSAGFIG
jgi:uncharacterized protein YkwD